MLDANLKTQLTAYLEKIVQPIEIVASLDGSEKSRELQELLQEIVVLTDKITLIERTDDKLVANLAINFHGVKQSFTTSNHNLRPTQMKMHLVDGPFKMLEGTWNFKALRADACKIDFDMHYEFSSIILEQLVGPVFGMIANSMVDSFCKRADTVYA